MMDEFEIARQRLAETRAAAPEDETTEDFNVFRCYFKDQLEAHARYGMHVLFRCVRISIRGLVRPLVGWLVGPLVGPSVTLSSKSIKNGLLWILSD